MGQLIHRVQHMAVVASIAIAGGCAAVPCGAQVAPRLDLGGLSEVGEGERYLRLMQLTGTAPLGPWTSLPVPPARMAESGPTSSHPWSARFAPSDTGPFFRWLRPTVHGVVNTTYPVQDAIGPAWSGRGVSTAVQWGFAAHWRAVNLQLAPVAFLTQNADFPLAANGDTTRLRFADARFPLAIDAPQRFGDGPYGRLDAGTSTLALDLPVFSIGVTTAPQRWGPALEYPLVLGPSAGGFPHYYLTTAQPVDLRVMRLQVRLVGGILGQSAYSAAPAKAARRNMSGAVVSAMPGGVDGLELGVTRFFETLSPLTLRRALAPLSIRKTAGADPIDNSPGENQTASAFFRWALPRAGGEFYGELFREDYSGNLRRFILIPDDLSSFTLGLQRVTLATATRRRVFRFEISNSELSHQARLNRDGTAPFPPYLHGELLQGHTVNGRILGSPETYGGAGWRASFDSYDTKGRRTIGIERALRFDWLPTNTTATHPDVMYAVRWELLRFAGPRDYGLTILPSIDLNRNLEPGSDRFNLHVVLTARGW